MQTNANATDASMAKYLKTIIIKFSDNVPNANWNRDNRQANLNRNEPRNQNENNGARSSARNYVLRDLSHPPSILPISANLLCV